jgi:putative MFS transporter
MTTRNSDELLSAYDDAPLNRRYWTTYAVLTIGISLDYFDFFIVAFLIAVVGPQWHMTYGQSSLILLAGGVGGIAGALVCGSLGDVWGRKTVLVGCSFICAVAAGAISLIPTGSVVMFTILRFIVGFALGGTVTPFNTLLVETTPTRYRTVLSSLGVVFPTVGGVLAGLASATLMGAIGWRGVAALGMAPAVVGLLAIFLMPESVRWLIARGRFVEARKEVAKLRGVPAESLPLPTTVAVVPPRGRLSELYAQPRLFWLVLISWLGISTAEYAILLWGPTIFSMLLKIPVMQAAHYMVYLSLFGIFGKITFSFVAQWLGRRTCGMLAGFAGAVALVAAAYFHSVVLAGFPIFVLLVMVAFLFVDGNFANVAPYSVEAYGVRLGSRASGFGQAVNSIGRIIGPLCLALIAGTSNLLAPAATEAAVLPTFLFLAGCLFAVGLVFTLLAPETRGVPIPQGDEEPTGSAAGDLGLAKQPVV